MFCLALQKWQGREQSPPGWQLAIPNMKFPRMGSAMTSTVTLANGMSGYFGKRR